MMRVVKVKDYKEIPNNYTGIVKYFDRSKYWYLNGSLHREDGPAVKWANGEKHWYLNGKQHREDGPAIEYVYGEKAWFLNGEFLFWLSRESQPFVLLEEFVGKDGKGQIKVLTQRGIETWPNLPGLKELADNWE